MALPGFLSDLPLIGADIFNARAQAEEESRLLQQEEEEREAKRRREALSMAIAQLKKEDLETQRDRHREELRRIRKGLTATPTEESTAPSIGLGVRGDDFDEYTKRFEEVTELQTERARSVTEAREQTRARYRADRPDAPPNLDEAQDASREIVRSMITENPLLTPEQIWERVSSEEGKSAFHPSIQLLIGGEQVNLSTIRSAYNSEGMNDPVFERMKQGIDALCGAGVPQSEVMASVRQNPNYNRYEDALRTYIGTNCGG